MTRAPGLLAEDVELVARAIYEDSNKGCWSWGDSGLDNEHPGARERYLRYARAAIAAWNRRPTAPASADVATIATQIVSDWWENRHMLGNNYLISAMIDAFSPAYQESGLARLARTPAPDGDGTTVGIPDAPLVLGDIDLAAIRARCEAAIAFCEAAAKRDGEWQDDSFNDKGWLTASSVLAEMLTALTAALAQLSEARAALKPFANAWIEWNDPDNEGTVDSFCGENLLNEAWERATQSSAEKET